MRHSAVMLAFLLTMDGAVSQGLSDEQRNERAFGERVNMGKVLVENLKNACGHALDVAISAPPQSRMLLLADRKMTAFDAQACNGVCDKLQINNSVARCRSERGIAGCVIYAAVFDRRVIQLSIDPTRFDLEKDCAK